MYFSIFPVVPLLLLINFPIGESVKNNSRDEICLSVLPESYDPYSPPLNKGGNPTRVFVQIEVLDLDEINEETMDFRLHAFIRTVWDDDRFLPNRTLMHKDCMKYVWLPDLMFEESKNIIDVGQNNIFFDVKDDHIYLSQRYSFKVVCMMDFHRYPFDVQHCLFTITFMATDDSEATLEWFDHNHSPYKNHGAVLITKEVAPLQFIIGKPTTHTIVKGYTYKNFTYLMANFTLCRRLMGSIVNYYMPSALLVVISWITFWLHEEASSERVTLTMTALLTICTQGDQYKSELPPVNYITAMDIWFFVCVFMLFSALVEFAFSFNAYRKQKKLLTKQKNISKLEVPKHPDFPERKQDGLRNDETLQDKTKRFAKRLKFDGTTKLDSVSKVLFPAVFSLFTVTYWMYYLWFSE